MATIRKVNEEAVKKIAERVYDNGSTVINRNDLEEMFPELKKESEDERIRKRLIHLVNKSHEQGGYALHKDEAEEILAWLEKQGEQRPAEWSPEDEAWLNAIIDDAEQEALLDTQQIDWLKSLKDRVQPKQEWSDEDKEMIDDIIRSLPRMSNGSIAILPSVAEEYANRLSSLRPYWKPSKEQMQALEEVCDLYCDVYNFTPPKALLDLFTDLKNLMN